MNERFERPTDILSMQDMFAEREVGVTHPDVSSHIRFKDNGDVEIISGEGLGIVFNRKNRSITIFADSIRFLTKEGTTLRWNKNSFNDKANTFNEPTFIPTVNQDLPSLYKGIADYYED